MTVKFVESFDHYTTEAQLLSKWTAKLETGTMTMAIADGYGRRGTAGLRTAYVTGSNAYVRYSIYNIGNDATGVMGIAHKSTAIGGAYSSSYGTTGFGFMDGDNYQLGVWFDGGTVTVRRGNWAATILGTSSKTLLSNVWYYIELGATINNTTGSFELRINGVNVTSNSGIDTQTTGNARTNGVFISSRPPGGHYDYWDDVYYLNDSGSIANDFLGDVKVECLFPSGAGSSTDWTPSAGSNYECVDEASPNDDTDYISEYIVSDHDTYACDDLVTTSGSIYAVQHLLRARKIDAGNRSLKTVYRGGTTDYPNSNTHSIGDNYVYYSDILEQDPDTSSAWTISGVNAGEFGVELEA